MDNPPVVVLAAASYWQYKYEWYDILISQQQSKQEYFPKCQTTLNTHSFSSHYSIQLFSDDKAPIY